VAAVKRLLDERKQRAMSDAESQMMIQRALQAMMPQNPPAPLPNQPQGGGNNGGGSPAKAPSSLSLPNPTGRQG
jgi:hypothetical protein